MDPERPDVIVDFVFEDGLLFIELRNIGARPAFRVHTRFDPRICGLGGETDISSLQLFQNVEFFAPQKRIRTLLDSAAAYFARGEATQIAARVSYRDEARKGHSAVFRHDLDIYRDIAYVGGGDR